jgi:hypothetical protein
MMPTEQKPAVGSDRHRLFSKNRATPNLSEAFGQMIFNIQSAIASTAAMIVQTDTQFPGSPVLFA